MSDLDRLVSVVLGSHKYGRVSPDVIRHVGSRELSAHRSLKEAIKATKNKLHQVGGAYLSPAMEYGRWEKRLSAGAQSGDPVEMRAACVAVMQAHSSTRERLPILDAFYSQTLVGLPAVHTVLDIACGLNPLARPWMPLPEDVLYFAYDMYADMLEFVARFFQIAGVHGEAQARDIVESPPQQSADLALLLKALPCLEQLDRSAGLRLLDAINAPYLLVSFPARSLGGRHKGMAENYEAHFWELIAGRPWGVQRFEFATELAFLVCKDQSRGGVETPRSSS
jgi:16S rRNA (guanine(1405)-N(7))-methyltransferase